MRRFLLTGLAGWLLAAAILYPPFPTVSLAQAGKMPPPPPKLKIGDMVPDFKLQYFDGTDLKDVSLSQYRGKSNVVLAFYIFAFTGG